MEAREGFTKAEGFLGGRVPLQVTRKSIQVEGGGLDKLISFRKEGHSKTL